MADKKDAAKKAKTGQKEEKKPAEAPEKKGAQANTAEAAAPTEEPKKKEKKKKEKKSQKERPKSKTKHSKVQVWKLYEVKDGKAWKKRESCQRCGAGTFLAVYKNRKYCGKCGWAHIKTIPSPEKAGEK